MKASENKIIRFLEGHDKRFVIPVYQRNYDWKKENCRQLYDDLIEAARNDNRKSHFFGSIVFLYNDDNNDDGQEFIIIDGQQRITTLSLLMLALIHEYEENGEDNDLDVELIRNEYLIGKYNKEEKIKLKQIKEDDKALNALFAKDEKNYVSSNITTNYRYFRELLKKSEVKLNSIFSAIKRLDIVEIRLKNNEDDPQLIFESLNSTGLDLSEADKARNFILMRLSSKKQNEYYEKYWNKIEEFTKYNVSGFLRDFITCKEYKAPVINKVYFAFKEYVRKKSDEAVSFSTEDILSELLRFAGYYGCIINSTHENKKIQKAMQTLNNLGMTVAYPFLLTLLDEHCKKVVSDTDLFEILILLESFFVRRVICDVPTNVLNKLFAALGRDIKNFPDYREAYSDVVKYVFSRKRGSQRFPADEEMKERMPLKDMYNMNSKNKMHIFQSLENFGTREKVDLENLVENKELTFEHIMPQTLSKAWKESLGAEHETIHAKYLHTIGNLTFTAYNSEMSNKTFSEKKTIQGGFLQSKFYLNEFVKDQNAWNEKTILERANLLINRSLQVWKSCETDYKNIRDIHNTYGIDDDIDFTGKKIKYFSVFGQEIPAEHWIDFFQQLCIILYDLESTKFKRFLSDDDFRKKTWLISGDETELRRPIKIADDIFLEGNLNTEYMLGIVKIILDKLEIDRNEVSISLKEDEVV